MAENHELLTIKEFAEASGRSQQTIYKQIATRLSAYLHEIDGQKFIERKALAEVFKIGVQPEENNSDNFENNPNNPLYAILREELAAKNRHIEQLTAQLAEQIQINKELAQSINKDRAKELAGTLQQLLPDAAPEGHCEPVEAFQDEEAQEPAPEPAEPQKVVLEAVKGLSFREKWKLLFKKGE